MSSHPSAPIITALPLNTNAGGLSRKSLNKDFAAKLRQVSGQTARTLQRTANYIAPIAPGAALLSAGLGNVANNLATDFGTPNASNLAGLEGGDIASRFGDMQNNMMSRSMEFLALQEQVQRRSEEFQMRSNISKLDHDTKKNSISNMR